MSFIIYLLMNVFLDLDAILRGTLLSFIFINISLCNGGLLISGYRNEQKKVMSVMKTDR